MKSQLDRILKSDVNQYRFAVDQQINSIDHLQECLTERSNFINNFQQMLMKEINNMQGKKKDKGRDQVENRNIGNEGGLTQVKKQAEQYMEKENKDNFRVERVDKDAKAEKGIKKVQKIHQQKQKNKKLENIMPLAEKIFLNEKNLPYEPQIFHNFPKKANLNSRSQNQKLITFQSQQQFLSKNIPQKFQKSIQTNQSLKSLIIFSQFFIKHNLELKNLKTSLKNLKKFHLTQISKMKQDFSKSITFCLKNIIQKISILYENKIQLIKQQIQQSYTQKNKNQQNFINQNSNLSRYTNQKTIIAEQQSRFQQSINNSISQLGQISIIKQSDIEYIGDSDNLNKILRKQQKEQNRIRDYCFKNGQNLAIKKQNENYRRSSLKNKKTTDKYNFRQILLNDQQNPKHEITNNTKNNNNRNNYRQYQNTSIFQLQNEAETNNYLKQQQCDTFRSNTSSQNSQFIIKNQRNLKWNQYYCPISGKNVQNNGIFHENIDKNNRNQIYLASSSSNINKNQLIDSKTINSIKNTPIKANKISYNNTSYQNSYNSSYRKKQQAPHIPSLLKPINKIQQNDPNRYNIPLIQKVVISEPVVKDGFGILKMGQETIYKGLWKNYNFHGKGKLSLNNYLEYQGNFQYGMFQGRGCLKIQDKCYIGEFHNNCAQGRGTLKMQNQQIIGIWQGNRLIEKY